VPRSNRGLSPEQRSLRARMAAHAMHAQNDSRETSAKGRAAFLSRFENQVDPDGVLSLAERTRRAEHARKAYFAALALKSSKARSKAKREVSTTDAA
jgi:hypothetical protein